MHVASERVLPPLNDEFRVSDQNGLPSDITPQQKEQILTLFHRLRKPVAQAWSLANLNEK